MEGWNSDTSFIGLAPIYVDTKENEGMRHVCR